MIEIGKETIIFIQGSIHPRTQPAKNAQNGSLIRENEFVDFFGRAILIQHRDDLMYVRMEDLQTTSRDIAMEGFHEVELGQYIMLSQLVSSPSGNLRTTKHSRFWNVTLCPGIMNSSFLSLPSPLTSEYKFFFSHAIVVSIKSHVDEKGTAEQVVIVSDGFDVLECFYQPQKHFTKLVVGVEYCLGITQFIVSSALRHRIGQFSVKTGILQDFGN